MQGLLQDLLTVLVHIQVGIMTEEELPKGAILIKDILDAVVCCIAANYVSYNQIAMHASIWRDQ